MNQQITYTIIEFCLWNSYSQHWRRVLAVY